MDLGEFALIDCIRNQYKVPEEFLGIGDDCAVIPQRDGLETLLTTDMLMEGVHFLLDDVNPYSLGWKSAAVNISDIAGMGGKPVASFLSFALPKKLSDTFLKEFLRGYKDLSDRFDCPLLGGDTTSSLDRLCISVSVLGNCPSGLSRKRSAAQEGDIICVSGFLGDSAAGLQVILKGLERGELESELVRRHYRPVPRVGEGIALSMLPGVHAMMDISDGIGSDLRHILDESHKAAEVDIASLPLSEQLKEACHKYGWDPVKLALNGGEDYELLFTVSPEAFAEALPVPSYPIGRIVSGEGIRWIGRNEDFMGFRHF